MVLLGDIVIESLFRMFFLFSFGVRIMWFFWVERAKGR